MKPFLCVPLDVDMQDTSTFDSGRPALDQWLDRHAAAAQRRRVARTFVWLDEESRVVAYYSLAGHLVERADLGRLGRGGPERVPAILLARLALDRSLHGRGYGSTLLVDALSRAVHASRHVAARYVVVDALDETAAAFYDHHGFRALAGSRLVRPLRDIEQDLLAWQPLKDG